MTTCIKLKMVARCVSCAALVVWVGAAARAQSRVTDGTGVNVASRAGEAGRGGTRVQARETYEQMLRRYDYDRAAPLDVREAGVVKRDGGVTVHDISYEGPKGGRVPAYLVVPAGKGPFAGVVFGHWAMENSPTRNRTEFLEEAVALARAGAVSILPDAPFARPGFKEPADPFGPEAVGVFAQQLFDLRRAVDVLVARRDVDARRIAYVGHSYNANAGGVLAGVERRIKTFVLMAGTLSDEEALRSDDPPMPALRKKMGEDRVEGIIAETRWLDPAHFVGRAAPASVLLQYARNDGFLNEARERHYFSLVSRPKALKIYDTTHALNAAARRDRFDWLRSKLRLRRLDPAVLDRIPQTK